MKRRHFVGIAPPAGLGVRGWVKALLARAQAGHPMPAKPKQEGKKALRFSHSNSKLPLEKTPKGHDDE